MKKTIIILVCCALLGACIVFFTKNKTQCNNDNKKTYQCKYNYPVSFLHDVISSYNKFIALIQRGYRLIFYDAGIG